MKQILVFVLFAAMLCWMMFSPIYKHVFIVREALLQKEVDYLLETGASGSRGYIDDAMVEASRSRLEQAGMSRDQIRYDISASDGGVATSSARPLLRGTGLILTISYPYERLFQIDSLIGIAVPDPEERMAASGIKMSEYVP
ncbi:MULTISPECIES: hypothetical protein [unclassified Paenibacillus]|uniref:hypothetical protein n=1 Tax=unclassified Paenibacillus TaxID=185978 RepID=UPI0009561CA6|nr:MULTISPECIES: hypothetical protein [unclassified Paenibacillus]ASS68796.1 hypothetical protein CIC07_23625 [Paenibacillus sp. RUD330]SIR57865.1 hypothetical protein SAMN05880555_4326 [Paenibacillus sp. RU4X]SIR66598.1 hypothetical protein SAMN05880570_4328 [Paenibacillus sp. RU4T]